MNAYEVYHENLLKWSDVQGHLPRFFDAAGGNVLEIGVREGYSTSAFLAGIERRGGHLWSVDIEDCPIFPEHPHWTFLHRDSVADKSEILKIIPKSIDLLFVDGDHSFESCYSDLITYGPISKTIFVHDTEAPNFPGVREAVVAYASSESRSLEWVRESFGLGILRW